MVTWVWAVSFANQQVIFDFLVVEEVVYYLRQLEVGRHFKRLVFVITIIILLCEISISLTDVG